MSEGLTNKREMFCKEFVKCDNKTMAYHIAYDTSNMSDKQVNEEASKLSKVPKVAQRIGELKNIAAEIAEKEFKTDSRELLRHLTILRKSRIDEYVDFVEIEHKEMEEYEGEMKESIRVERVLQFKPFTQLTEEQLMCVESIKDTRNGIELKLHGKDWTIEKIAKHIGFYEKDNKQSNPNNGQPITINFKQKS